jgi:hypothetical protein
MLAMVPYCFVGLDCQLSIWIAMIPEAVVVKEGNGSISTEEVSTANLALMVKNARADYC